ncbi:hypothetical protein ACIQF6_00845 [Kitasatospora sp. NPDC092948]|uniref:FAD binding domain-containing protein n=1 Tax=Kitasatospora sp. NPDC092948 TaxID=3364088 RepID=UPI003802ED60
MTASAPSGLSSVGIVGGSLAGLFHAVALTALGLDVDVWERSGGRPADRGAGIVLQPAVARFLREFCGVEPDRVTVPVTHRQYFAADGGVDVLPMRQQMISWGTIHQALRDALPAGRYHGGQPVTGLAHRPDGATVRVGGADRAVDLAILADGSGSRHRGLVAPAGAPRYAGYVAHRGVVDEADLPRELVARFDGRFSFWDGDRSQFLCYFIPGDHGAVAAGRRRLNWVWYARADRSELDRLTTDRHGVRHGLSLPPGLLDPRVGADLLARARATLPEPLRRLVEHTAEPFVQAILDAHADRMRDRRILLTGDAAFVVRPHTAAATEKAAAEALTLHRALREAPSTDAALRAWERLSLAEATAIHRQGVGLGRRLGLDSPEATG